MSSQRAPLCLLACEPARALGERISQLVGVSLTPSRDVWFACGEGKHVIDRNIRGCDVYLFQCPVVPQGQQSTYDRFTMLLHAADAARCADADRVTVVVPYLPGGRQDKRKRHVREGVSTGLFARMLDAAGVSMVLTVEPHNEATVGCYDPRRTVFEGVSVTRPFAAYLKEQSLTPDVVASTDAGGLEMARGFAQRLECGLVALSKERDYGRPNVVSTSQVIGDVRGKNVLVVDDIIDTAGSMVAAAHALWEAGARDLTLAGVHMLLSGPAWERLDRLRAEAEARGVRFEVVGTSSIVHPNPPPYYRSFGLEPILSDIIRSVNSRGSVRALE